MTWRPRFLVLLVAVYALRCAPQTFASSFSFEHINSEGHAITVYDDPPTGILTKSFGVFREKVDNFIKESNEILRPRMTFALRKVESEFQPFFAARFNATQGLHDCDLLFSGITDHLDESDSSDEESSSARSSSSQQVLRHYQSLTSMIVDRVESLQRRLVGEFLEEGHHSARSMEIKMFRREQFTYQISNTFNSRLKRLRGIADRWRRRQLDNK